MRNERIASVVDMIKPPLSTLPPTVAAAVAVVGEELDETSSSSLVVILADPRVEECQV